jgi:hypothetical protein
MAKRNTDYSFKFDLDVDTGAVIATLREKDEKDEFVSLDTKSFALSSIPSEVRAFTDLYGLSKLVQDRASQVPAGPAKLDEMQGVYDSLVAGNLERERKAGAPTVSAEVEALAAIKGCSVADIQKSIRKYTKEQKEKIFANPAVVAKAAELRKVRETTEIDLDDMTL